MTSLSDTSRFAAEFRRQVDEFRQLESLIRDQYAQTSVPPEVLPDMLERPTRRFLVDGLLRALDWEVDNPTQIAEEARARTAAGGRLYYDYLGIAPQTRAPVLLLEAKGFDAPLPRKPKGAVPDAQGMSELIATALDAIKRGDQKTSVIAEWEKFLSDLHAYIGAMDDLAQTTLRRAAITAGGWIIVFVEPIATFRQDDPVNTAHVICFASLDDMLERHAELHGLLHRTRIVDTLPSTLSVSEALAMIPPQRIGRCFQAALVVTATTAGARRQQYPVRTVYPSLLIETDKRWFAIVDYLQYVEEPKQQDRITEFVVALEYKGAALVARLRQSFGVALIPEPIQRFPGFPELQTQRGAFSLSTDPLPGSSAERLGDQDAPAFIRRSTEAGAAAEFVVVTGTGWFYKLDVPSGEACVFHLWKEARNSGVAADTLLSEYGVQSFTIDGEDRHCANSDLHSIRRERCHLHPVETHMCCKACIFVANCWAVDAHRMPCP